jgi:3-oxoacid CoA-transferase
MFTQVYRASIVSSGSRVKLRYAAIALSTSRKYSTAAADVPPSKIWDSAEEAVKDIESGQTLLCGGLSTSMGSILYLVLIPHS